MTEKGRGENQHCLLHLEHKVQRKSLFFLFNYFFTDIYSNQTSVAVAKAITVCHFRELQYKHTVNTQ